MKQMAKLTPDDILKLARLARITLTEQELEQFGSELSAILDYVEQLSAIDTDGLEPTAQVTGLSGVTRPDELVDYGVSSQDLLKNVPGQQDNFIKVKRVLG